MQTAPHCASGKRHAALSLLALTLFFLIGFFPAMPQAQEEVVQIRLKNRHADEILPMAKPFLSPQGHISADKRSNSLIVIDNPAVTARIRQFVRNVDREVPLLKIRIRYESADADQANATGASVREKTGDTTIEAGREKRDDTGVEADLKAGAKRTQRQSEYFLRVRSGSTAYLESGYDVPHRERWRELSHRHGYIHDGVVFRRVTSGYHIRPALTGGQVRMEIVPRISYLDNRGRKQNIQFAQAATTLFVPLDTWVDIGGILGGHREIDRQILADSRHASDERLTMRLLVTID